MWLKVYLHCQIEQHNVLLTCNNAIKYCSQRSGESDYFLYGCQILVMKNIMLASGIKLKIALSTNPLDMQFTKNYYSSTSGSLSFLTTLIELEFDLINNSIDLSFRLNPRSETGRNFDYKHQFVYTPINLLKHNKLLCSSRECKFD